MTRITNTQQLLKITNLTNFKIISLLTLSVILLSFMPYADASHIVSFSFSQYNLNDGEPGFSEVIITVNDPSADTTSNPDTISVTVTSTSDPSGVTLVLTETGGTTGTFQNTNLLFTTGNAKYKISNTVTVNIVANSINNPLIIDTTTVDVRSASGGSLTLTLTETGLDTGVFEGTLGFTSGASSGNLLSVVNGDVISIEYLPTNEIFHGLIVPNPNSGINAIATAPGETITVTYLGDSDTATMATTGPGSGSGGPVRPSLVIDAVGGGGGSEHLTKPTFGINHATNQQAVDYGFTMNGIPFPITENHHTNFLKQQVKTGQENTFSIKTFAPFELKVVELDLGIPTVGEAHFAESMIEVWLDDDQNVDHINVNQKENLVDKNSIKAKAWKTSCTQLDFEANCLEVEINAIFLEKPSNEIFALKAIDKRARFQITYLNEGLDVIGESLNPPKKIEVLDRLGYLKTITLTDKNTGVDEYGNIWYRNGNIWETEYKIPIRNDTITTHGIDRNNIKFKEYSEEQIIKAQKIFNDIVGNTQISNPDFGRNYYSEILYSQKNTSEDPISKQQLYDEIIRVEKIFKLKWPEIVINFQN